LTRPTRTKAWRWFAGGLIALALLFVAIMVAPLLHDQPNYARPTSEQQRSVSDGMVVSPDSGAASTQVTLSAEGLPEVTEIRILGGLEEGEMQELGVATTSGEGSLTAQLAVPESAEPGRPYYFALLQEDERLALATFNVVVLLDVAPSGVGGAIPN
jgi:hypothetical protein